MLQKCGHTISPASIVLIDIKEHASKQDKSLIPFDKYSVNKE